MTDQDRLDVLAAAAANVSDRRTLTGDGGYWVSRKEMRALDLALGREDIGTVPNREPGTYRTPEAAAVRERDELRAAAERVIETVTFHNGEAYYISHAPRHYDSLTALRAALHREDGA